MATLYVENVPDDLYEALRAQARRENRSIAAEVLAMLKDHVPTEQELARRRDLLERLEKFRATPVPKGVAYQSAEDMIREDRDR
jgi:plasmid stability protein